MISYEECMRLGLLKRIAPSLPQARLQMKKAWMLLDEAKRDIANKATNSAVMAGYAAMFDAARAILFKDGFREKSHACAARYLEVKYGKEFGEAIKLLDSYRDQRHKTQYSGDYYPSLDDAGRLVKFAEWFVKRCEDLLE